MNPEFDRILQGLMDNRRLSARAVSRASGRAESTINQLLIGRIPPRADILQDIAPALQMHLVDLIVIAGLPAQPAENHARPYPAAHEIGQLVAAASFLSPEQVIQLVEQARALKAQTPGGDV